MWLKDNEKCPICLVKYSNMGRFAGKNHYKEHLDMILSIYKKYDY